MKTMKRTLALLLAVAMLLGMAACGGKPQQTLRAPQQVQPQQAQPDQDKELSREDKELIAELIGDEANAGDKTDEELDQLVEQLLQEATKEEAAEIVNLGNTTPKEELPSVDVSENKDAYDDNGAMKEPFDQVYPELIEKGEVAFSGESILVKLSSDKLTDGLKAAGIGALEEIVPMEKASWYEAKLTEGTDAKEALEAVRELKETLLAEYNYEIQTAALDDYKHFDKDKDEDFKKNGHNKDQWHFHHCGIVDGYEEMENEGGTPSVVVAVIDSGVDYEHEDLKDNMWVNAKEIPDNGRDDDGNGYVDDYYGVDMVAGKGSGNDDNGHGTHVAGIIAARNNNVGVLGIAYNVKIMSVKAAMHNGTLNQSAIAKSVLYAYEMGAEVINMSFGGTACSIAVQDALATAYTRCVLVASAGNSGMPNERTDYYLPLPNYPAALTYVLGVMSVDQNGVESSFSNWDAKAFNGVEYELYAPGENIMSTLPGNRYGYLSGTSMAAPVVSAFAAILRSEFSDRDMYPTKFIYGQLSATSEIHADCIDPEKHTVGGFVHNLPQVVDLHAALTKLPKPEVNLQDYYIFDTKELSEKNNGDGVIDAGETIALGVTLRNRWGMSKNTLVTIDTLENGISDPYVTIVNPTVDYGSVGTYSTQDAGRIYTDELFTGWEKPFILKIAEDIPNDYRMTFHVTVTCENALDEEDTATYTSNGDIDENARNGVILPSIIEEDMVLTKNNLYIIPSATIIPEGVTVKVEPGTHIQFWSDDANDPYADNYIAYLVVNGNFLVEGTKEDPVYIYPSQLMDHYNVEIDARNNGYVSMKYADITNFAYINTSNRISLAEHCTFRNNYGTDMYYRYLSEGVVEDSGSSSVSIGTLNAKDCVFYKLGLYSGQYLYGTFDRCIFTQCGISFYGEYANCVFLGNSFVDQTNPDHYSQSSRYEDPMTLPSANGYNVHYWAETGTTYVRVENWEGADNAEKYIREVYDAEPVVIETEEEYRWLLGHVANYSNYMTNSSNYGYIWCWAYDLGIKYDREADCYTFHNGQPLPEFIDLSGLPENYVGKLGMNPDGVTHAWDGMHNTVYEIPGPILPTDITFSEYAVDMDTETTYQLQPQNTPVQLPADQFLYESTDEGVLTVSETGLVTPVAKGTADVWVYSLDRAVKNRVTFNVKDYVALEAITFPMEKAKLAAGESVSAKCILTPADTTRRSVSYVSSDPGVVTVKNGVLTAVGKGTATVTATCEGLTATMEVSTWVRATGLESKEYYHTRTRESCDTSLPKVVPYPANADLDLQWRSDNESIMTVENGKLVMKKAGTAYLYAKDLNSGKEVEFRFTIIQTAPVIEKDVIAVQLGAEPMALPEVTFGKGAETTPQWVILDPAVAVLEDNKIFFKGAGITTLRVTDMRTGLTDEIFIYVTEGEVPRVKELQVDGQYGNYVYALLDNGDLYRWVASNTAIVDPQLVCSQVKAFDCCDYYLSVVLEDNSIQTYVYYNAELQCTYQLPEQTVVDVAGSWSNAYGGCGNLYALTEDGTVYALGSDNDYGQLGNGTTESAAEFTKVLLNEPVQQIAYTDSVAYYLTKNGNLYISGGSGLQVATPIMIARNVTWLDNSGKYFVTNNRLASFISGDTEPSISEYSLEGYSMLDVRDYNGSYFEAIAEKNGDVYRVYQSGSVADTPWFALNSSVVAGGTACVYSYYGNDVFYAVTEDGMLFANGSSYGSSAIVNAFLGMTPATSLDSAGRPVFLPVVQTPEKLNLLQTNLDSNNVLSAKDLELTLNKQLLKVSATIYENDIKMVAHTEFSENILRITPSVGFAEGAKYKVEVHASATAGISNVYPAEDIVIEFTYQAAVPEETVPEESVPEETVPEESVPEETEPAEPVVYEAILDEKVERCLTAQIILRDIKAYIAQTQHNVNFYGNAILNPISTDFEVSHWLRIQASSVEVGEKLETPLSGNYWGSVNERAIGLQLIDYADFPNYARLMYAPYLTEAPENTFPFVTSVTLWNEAGEQVTTVGNEKVTFRVTFNRDMDTSIPLLVRFGSAFPYGDYEIEGQYTDARTWEGVYTLNTLIENGYQYFSISNGCSATEDLPLQLDQYRFFFEIDTTAAQALIMQGTATDTGVELTWTQDDFDTLMGYNVYRSTKEDGLYTRLNSTVIPADTMQWFDDTVEPGVVYYYNFTVVKTDLTESEPSGKISLMSKDTMAPNIYHSPVTGAFTGTNLVITATVTDNLNIAYANLYYRSVGQEQWKTVRMNKLNDKYSAIITAENVTLEGIEYYIEAFDGVSFTYKGAAETPFTIAVQEAVGADALGDVDGDGVITNRDALVLLYAINDKYNMSAEEFARADLNGDGELWAAEALRILQYVSGVVGSVKM